MFRCYNPYNAPELGCLVENQSLIVLQSITGILDNKSIKFRCGSLGSRWKDIKARIGYVQAVQTNIYRATTQGWLFIIFLPFVNAMSFVLSFYYFET